MKNVKYRNPYSIEVEYKVSEGKAGKEHLLHFKQTTGANTATWTNNLTRDLYEMVYFSEYDPANDLLPGVSSGGVTTTDAQLVRYLTRFGAIFFEQGAMPVLLLPFENIAESEAKKVENFFQRQATGIRNAFRVLALRGAQPLCQVPCQHQRKRMKKKQLSIF